MGILISQYKDPYKPTSIMESRRVFFVAQLSNCRIYIYIVYNYMLSVGGVNARILQVLL